MKSSDEFLEEFSKESLHKFPKESWRNSWNCMLKNSPKNLYRSFSRNSAKKLLKEFAKESLKKFSMNISTEFLDEFLKVVLEGYSNKSYEKFRSFPEKKKKTQKIAEGVPNGVLGVFPRTSFLVNSPNFLNNRLRNYPKNTWRNLVWNRWRKSDFVSASILGTMSGTLKEFPWMNFLRKPW